MATLSRITPEALYNENLYPTSKIGYTVVTAGGSNVLYDSFSANYNDALRFVSVNSSTTVVDLSESVRIPFSGNYAITLPLFKTNPDFEWQIILKVYKNGVLFDTYGVSIQNVIDSFNDNVWNSYSQVIPCTQGQIITFRLEVTSSFFGHSLYISAPKFEFLNKETRFPTIYTYPARLIINENNITGWAQYVDNLRTTTAPLVITDTVNFTTIPCNGATKDETQLPAGFTEMFNTTTNKLVAKNVNDKFLLNVRFKARTSAANSSFTIGLDIGATNLISPEDRSFSVGANTQQEFSFLTTYFTRETFIANGGLIKIRPRSGTLSIYDISVIPELTHKSR